MLEPAEGSLASISSLQWVPSVPPADMVLCFERLNIIVTCWFPLSFYVCTLFSSISQMRL